MEEKEYRDYGNACQSNFAVLPYERQDIKFHDAPENVLSTRTYVIIVLDCSDNHTTAQNKKGTHSMPFGEVRAKETPNRL